MVEMERTKGKRSLRYRETCSETIRRIRRVIPKWTRAAKSWVQQSQKSDKPRW